METQPPTSAVVKMSEDESQGAIDLLGWLKILGENTSEPREFYLQRITLRDTKTQSIYSDAAVKLAEYIEDWDHELGPEIKEFFNNKATNGDYSFTNWTMQHLGHYLPQLYGFEKGSPSKIVPLQDALCTCNLGALHISAALGMCTTFRNLSHRGQDVSQDSFLGTPLFCAIMGLGVFKLDRRPTSLEEVISKFGVELLDERIEIIRHIIILRKDPGSTILRLKSGEKVSMASLLLCVALAGSDNLLLLHFLRNGGWLDEAFVELLNKRTLLKIAGVSPSKLARPLLNFYDACYDDNLWHSNVPNLRALIDTLASLLRSAWEKCKAEGRDLPVKGVTEAQLHQRVVKLMAESDHTGLGRLMADKRFDPNHVIEGDEDKPRLLHWAVGGSDEDLIELLVKHGADIESRDGRGRTPLMLSEDPAILKKLVVTYKARLDVVDKKDYNMWQLFCATNDSHMLDCLNKLDKNRNKHLGALNDRGNTPFFMALISRDIGAHHFSHVPNKPRAAQYLLDIPCDGLTEWQDDWFRGEAPTTHLAMRWGDADTVERMAFYGANFKSLDHRGRSPLHYLSFGVVDDFLDLALEMCIGAPLLDFDRNTPADTILYNLTRSPDRFDESDTDYALFVPSAAGYAPVDSYWRTMPTEFEDYEALGTSLWEYFGSLVVENGASYPNDHEDHIFFKSLSAALTIAHNAGEHKKYETQEERCPIYALLPPWFEFEAEAVRSGQVESIFDHISNLMPAINKILSHCGYMEDFCQTFEGLILFIYAIKWTTGYPRIAELISKRGKEAFIPDNLKDAASVWLSDAIVHSINGDLMSKRRLEAMINFLPRWVFADNIKKIWDAVRACGHSRAESALLRNHDLDVPGGSRPKRVVNNGLMPVPLSLRWDRREVERHAEPSAEQEDDTEQRSDD